MGSAAVEMARELILSGNSYLRLRSFPADRPNEARELLIENRMWFSSIGRQDDIFEGRPLFGWREAPPTLEELKEVVRRQSPDLSVQDTEAIAYDFFHKTQDPVLYEAAKRNFERRFRDIYQASSIACFFTDPFGVRNWLNYADRGRGYGLLFDLSIQWRFEAAEGMGQSDWVPIEVDYVARDARPKIELAFGPSDPLNAFSDIQGALLTKSDEWRDQKEERFVRVGIPNGYVLFPPESLKGLLLGHDIESTNREKLIELVRERPMPIAVFETRVSDQHLAIELRPVAI
jgi:hypothetical protein